MKIQFLNKMLLVADCDWPTTNGKARALFTVEWFMSGQRSFHRHAAVTPSRDKNEAIISRIEKHCQLTSERLVRVW